MRRSAQTVLCALILACLLGSVMNGGLRSAGASLADGSLPQLQLAPSMVTAGATVSIAGTHWPKQRELQAVVCGGGVFAVTSDCDLSHAVTFGPADNGVVRASLVVSVPPTPCPCVVMVTQVHPSAVEWLSLTIVGAPSAPLPSPAAQFRPRVRITHVEVRTVSSWTSWFGAAASRVLELKVHNESASTIRPMVVARWIDGSANHVIASPAPRPLAAGRSQQLSVPFALSTFASGTFPVVGQVTGAGFEVRMRGTAATTPWGLYALAVLVSVGLLLALAAWIGRHSSSPAVERRPDEPVDPLAGVTLEESPTEPLMETGVPQ